MASARNTGDGYECVEVEALYYDEKGQVQQALVKHYRILNFEQVEVMLFMVDLRKLKVVSLRSGREIASVSAIKAVEVAFGRAELLYVLMDDLCNVDFLESVIAERASPYRVMGVERNNHAVRGTKLYNRFFDALVKQIHRVPYILEEIVKLVSRNSGCHENTFIEYAFHGTPRPNLESICKNGMDPKLRKHGGDYFGLRASLSLIYCRSSEQQLSADSAPRMVVFLLLLPGLKRSFQSRTDMPFVVMQEVDHELPIAIVQIGMKQ